MAERNVGPQRHVIRSAAQCIRESCDTSGGSMVRGPGRCFVLVAMWSFASSWAGTAESSDQFETYRHFALKTPGNAKAGEQLFRSEKKLACENCHRITGAEK